MQPILMLRSSIPTKQLWKTNIKDAFSGMVAPAARPYALSVLGHPRETSIPARCLPLDFTGMIAKRCFGPLLFRRVRPVETRIYAFTRNSFAVVAMGILIFRTVIALQQAQNEIRTRVTSDDCHLATFGHTLSILSDRLTYDPRWSSPLPKDVNMTISVDLNNPNTPYEPLNVTTCTLHWSQPFNVELQPPDQPYYHVPQNRTLELFRCPIPQNPIRKWEVPYLHGINTDRLTYRMEVRSAERTPGGVFGSQMPHVWLVNELELPDLGPFNRTWSEASEVRAYLPPLKLLPGFHITSEARLITRRFIQSSIIKDIIFNSKPEYRRLSLYPIVESSVVALNSSDANIATATIQPSLAPGLMYYRNRADIRDPDVSPSVCDFIDDYRSGTILDVFGTVGGLFALLQAAHLLLFGRPLLWGLTGAKFITPFGLLGSCSSRGFRQRLREEYHGRSCEDGTDTVRIVKFLRDFVIDFGPADLDLERQSERDSAVSSPVLLNNDEHSAETRIPLMQLGSDATTVPPREDDEGTNRSNDPNHVHSAV